MSNIIAPLAGQTPPRVEKRAEEQVQYTIDISPLLSKTEVAICIENIICSAPIIEKCRTRKGKSIELFVTSMDLTGTAAFVEYKVTIQFKTTTNSIKSAVFLVKVYK